MIKDKKEPKNRKLIIKKISYRGVYTNTVCAYTHVKVWRPSGIVWQKKQKKLKLGVDNSKKV